MVLKKHENAGATFTIAEGKAVPVRIDECVECCECVDACPRNAIEHPLC